MTLRRYAPMKPSAGEVIPARVRIAVRARDRYCVCDRAGFPEEVQLMCRQNYGSDEMDHVRASHGIGMKSESTADNLVLLSPWAHRWKTEHGREARMLLLAYLERAEDPHDAHVDPVPGCPRCHWPIDFERGE